MVENSQGVAPFYEDLWTGNFGCRFYVAFSFDFFGYLTSNYAFIQGRFVGFLEQQRRLDRPGLEV